jgi:hypothetical protein
MPFSFPSSPTVGQTYAGPNNVVYTWNGTAWTGGSQSAGFVAKSGDSMTGALTLSGAPVNTLHAATKAYADGKIAKSGDTMTGPLVVPTLTVGTLGIPGERQWTDFTSQRTLGSTYQNDTSFDIEVSITLMQAAGAALSMGAELRVGDNVDGTTHIIGDMIYFPRAGDSAAGNFFATLKCRIPRMKKYSVRNFTLATLYKWSELRS